MKRPVLLLVAPLFAGCGSGGCIFPNTVVGCVGGRENIKVAPEVFRWQKVGQFGNTDPEQRKADMIECGVHPKYNFESSVGAIGLPPIPGETDREYSARRKKFNQCMKDKGYVQLGLLECGPVKENRGICK